MDEGLAKSELVANDRTTDVEHPTNADQFNAQQTKSTKAKPKATESNSTLKFLENSKSRRKGCFELQITALEEQKKYYEKRRNVN